MGYEHWAVFTCKRCRTEQNGDEMRGDAIGFRVGGVVVAAGDVLLRFIVCIDCFNGEFRMNSSKSSSTSSDLGGVHDGDDVLLLLLLCAPSVAWAMRKLISKSNGLCWFVLNDNERANELLNVGQALIGDWGLFGKRTSLLWRRVSIFFSLFRSYSLSQDTAVHSAFVIRNLWITIKNERSDLRSFYWVLLFDD